MKKKIIIDAEEDAEIKKVEKNIHKDKQKITNNQYIEWLIYMIAYAIVLIIVSKLFKSFYINTSHFGIYALLAAIIIHILNQTIKPLLKFITLPLTIISFGLLYPLSNVIILYMTSLLLGNKFIVKGILPTFIVAVIISFLNILIEKILVKPILGRKV